MTTDYKTYDDDECLGKKAPTLETLKFVKGDKTDVTSGKTNVILFWANYDKGGTPGATTAFSELHTKFPDVVFIGVSADPEEAAIERFLKKPDVTHSYPAAFDEGKKVNKLYTSVLASSAMSIPHAFIVNGEGNIVWHEQFSQFNTVAKSQFEQQLNHVVKGEPLEKNGPRPKDAEEEEEAGDAVEEEMSLF